MTKDTGDYEVGYGKPPKHSRFEKGRSGNPKGRPSGAKSSKQILEKELAEKVAVREGSKTRKISKMEVVIKRLVKDAAEGKPAARRELMALMRESEAKDDAAAAAVELSPTGHALIEEIMENAGLRDPAG